MNSEPTQKTSRIEIAKQALNFSIGHFTIFSATERENLHGHNFQVECRLTAPVGDDGLTFDYGILKHILRDLCAELDELVVLPEKSPYLKLEKENNYLVAVFNGERLPFLHRDVITLPIANTTVEEFSHYLLSRVMQEPVLSSQEVLELSVTVSSTPGQQAVASWTADTP